MNSGGRRVCVKLVYRIHSCNPTKDLNLEQEIRQNKWGSVDDWKIDYKTDFLSAPRLQISKLLKR